MSRDVTVQTKKAKQKKYVIVQEMKNCKHCLKLVLKLVQYPMHKKWCSGRKYIGEQNLPVVWGPNSILISKKYFLKFECIF